jgi:hypothetical protein
MDTIDTCNSIASDLLLNVGLAIEAFAAQFIPHMRS